MSPPVNIQSWAHRGREGGTEGSKEGWVTDFYWTPATCQLWQWVLAGHWLGRGEGEKGSGVDEAFDRTEFLFLLAWPVTAPVPLHSSFPLSLDFIWSLLITSLSGSALTYPGWKLRKVYLTCQLRVEGKPQVVRGLDIDVRLRGTYGLCLRKTCFGL